MAGSDIEDEDEVRDNLTIYPPWPFLGFLDDQFNAIFLFWFWFLCGQSLSEADAKKMADSLAVSIDLILTFSSTIVFTTWQLFLRT